MSDLNCNQPMNAVHDNHFRLSDTQQTILGWFQRNAPSLGELYKGSLRLLYDDQLPGYTRFVAHAVREIRNRLPEYLAGFKGGKRLDYRLRIEQLKKKWTTLSPLKNDVAGTSQETAEPSDDSQTIPIPIDIVREIGELIDDHLAVSEKRKDAAKSLFKAASIAGIDQAFPLGPSVDMWLDVTDWFMNLVHDGGKVDEDIGLDQTRKKFNQFEGMINSLVGYFYSTTDTLDEILQEANN